MKVLVVQPDLRAYRLPFFNALGECPGMSLTVLHSGEDIPGTSFSQIVSPKKRIGPLNLQMGALDFARGFDRVVIGLDMHWWNSIMAPIVLDNSEERLVYWGHGMGRSTIANLLRRRAIGRARAMIFYSDCGRRLAESEGWPKSKLFVAPNTMWVTNSEDMSMSHKRYLLYVGRIQDRKRIDLLIEAYFHLSTEMKEKYSLVIVGSGDSRYALERDVVDRGLKSVVFINGTTDDFALKKLFEKAAAYVSPGHVGLGVLHAFSYGVPVVTCESDNHAPEFNFLKNKVNSLICVPSVTALSNSLNTLLCDSDFYSRLGKNAFSTYLKEAHPSLMLKGFTSALL